MTLGESSDEIISTAQRSSQELVSSTQPLVEDDPAPPSKTAGWATTLLLACKQSDLALSDDLCNLLLVNLSVTQLPVAVDLVSRLLFTGL